LQALSLFAGLAVVTGLAVLSALRYGLPVGFTGVVWRPRRSADCSNGKSFRCGLFSYLCGEYLGNCHRQKKGGGFLAKQLSVVASLGQRLAFGARRRRWERASLFRFADFGIKRLGACFPGTLKAEAQEKSRRLMASAFVGVVILFFLGNGRAEDHRFLDRVLRFCLYVVGLNHFKNDLFQRFVLPVQIALNRRSLDADGACFCGLQGEEAIRFIVWLSADWRFFLAGTSLRGYGGKGRERLTHGFKQPLFLGLILSLMAL
jgi:hypothetical protein